MGSGPAVAPRDGGPIPPYRPFEKRGKMTTIDINYAQEQALREDADRSEGFEDVRDGRLRNATDQTDAYLESWRVGRRARPGISLVEEQK